jgi:hypothetical protein
MEVKPEVINPGQNKQKPGNPEVNPRKNKADPYDVKCIRGVANISINKNEFRFDQPEFNEVKRKNLRDILPIVAPKIYALIKNIENIDKKDAESGKAYKHFIYVDQNNVRIGVGPIASALIAYGYNCTVSREGGKFVVKAPVERDITRRKSFGFFTKGKLFGEQDFLKEDVDAVKTVFNSRGPEGNSHGERMRFVILDSRFKAGIDLYDVRYIHMVEPFLTDSDFKQALGRATRYCGQKGLEYDPKRGWPLEVFVYNLDVNEGDFENHSNIHSYVMSKIKIQLERFEDNVLSACREAAVDRDMTLALHSTRLIDEAGSSATQEGKDAVSEAGIDIGLDVDAEPEEKEEPGFLSKLFGFSGGKKKKINKTKKNRVLLNVTEKNRRKPGVNQEDLDAGLEIINVGENPGMKNKYITGEIPLSGDIQIKMHPVTPMDGVEPAYVIEDNIINNERAAAIPPGTRISPAVPSRNIVNIAVEAKPVVPVVKKPVAKPVAKPDRTENQYKLIQKKLREIEEKLSENDPNIIRKKLSDKISRLERKIKKELAENKVATVDGRELTVESLESKSRDSIDSYEPLEIPDQESQEDYEEESQESQEDYEEESQESQEDYDEESQESQEDSEEESHELQQIPARPPVDPVRPQAATPGFSRFSIGLEEVNKSAPPPSNDMGVLINNLRNNVIPEEDLQFSKKLEKELMGVTNYQKYNEVVNRVFGKDYFIKAPKLENLCISTPGKSMDLTPTQNFVRRYFTPFTPIKGMHFWHSTGSGKTCSAVGVVSTTFQKMGYDIMWVTKTTLRSDVDKNIFGKDTSPPCFRTVIEYNRAKEEMKKNNYPIPSDFQGSITQLAQINAMLPGYFYEPMSYRTLSNIANSFNKTRSRPTNLAERIRAKKGDADPISKTLIIIDEAENLIWNESLSEAEKPDTPAIEKMIQNSYRVSGKNSCRVLLMTATPYNTSPMQYLRLLNILIDPTDSTRSQFPNSPNAIDLGFSDFKKEYLDEEGNFTQNGRLKFMNNIRGCISYVNRENDPTQFAIMRSKTEVKTDLTTPENIESFVENLCIGNRISELTQLRAIMSECKDAKQTRDDQLLLYRNPVKYQEYLQENNRLTPEDTDEINAVMKMDVRHRIAKINQIRAYYITLKDKCGASKDRIIQMMESIEPCKKAKLKEYKGLDQLSAIKDKCFSKNNPAK